MEAIKKEGLQKQSFFYLGASDEARTRYLHLGKVALYQMSYTRGDKKDCSRDSAICQEDFKNFFAV